MRTLMHSFTFVEFLSAFSAKTHPHVRRYENRCIPFIGTRVIGHWNNALVAAASLVAVADIRVRLSVVTSCATNSWTRAPLPTPQPALTFALRICRASCGADSPFFSSNILMTSSLLYKFPSSHATTGSFSVYLLSVHDSHRALRA